MLGAQRDDIAFPSEPLAIVGMACRLPGADDLNSFWELMSRGGSGIREMPDDRMDRRLYLTERRGQVSKTYTSISGLIPARPDDPPSDFRSIDVEELRYDPCHEILCRVVDEARLNAGWSVECMSGTRTGVYVGHSCGSALGGELVFGSIVPEVADALKGLSDFQLLSESERNQILGELVTSIQNHRPVRGPNKPQLEANFAAQLVAKRFLLDGPQLVIDAACASSMIALALACAALTQGEIDHAIVSGASYSKTDSLVLFSQAESCSSSGSRPFDADADGLVGSEGYVAILIKKLSRARYDGDKIQGIIRGIGISSDGRGRSLWAPRKEGQLEAVRRAYSGSVTPQSVQYVEAHATSTQVGDATEMHALTEFFRDPTGRQQIPLGSVKSNLGHTLESAGLAGLVKSVLCMQRGFIPPTINLSHPNPAIDWLEGPFIPVESMISWPDVENVPRRAAVNAFGIGGLNAHVIVDGPQNQVPRVPSPGNLLIDQSKRTRVRRTGNRPPDHSQSLAIIGRGLVVPGAFDLNSFRKLLESGQSQLTAPSEERWRDTPFSATRPAIQGAYANARAGYIRGYQYDWRLHRIPPLQIEHGNPLQFMLLDAAQQALDESGYGVRPFNRSRAAVVVGTLFGGEFSHQLQIGLRLPELVDELSRALRNRNWSESKISKTCLDVERTITSIYPAIIDQTGSFTCSTQASRVAKTLNVMGGAMAIDAGDCSSLAALQSAQHMLNSGIVDFVFCAAAHRDLDAAGFEAWNYRTFEPIGPGVGSRSVERPSPGEGVVMFLLRRLSDARADGDKITGIIHEVRATASRNQRPVKTEKSSLNSGTNGKPITSAGVPASSLRTPELSQLTQQFGHLQSASGLFEILGATVEGEMAPSHASKTVVRTMTETSENQVVCEIPKQTHIQPPMAASPLNLENRLTVNLVNGKTASVTTRSEPACAFKDQPTLNGQLRQNDRSNGAGVTSRQPLAGDSLNASKPTVAVSSTTSNQTPRIIRIWGTDEAQLIQRLDSISSMPETDLDALSTQGFPDGIPYRLAFVTSSSTELVRISQIALKAIAWGASRGYANEHGIYYSGHRVVDKPNWAIVFPGQGSQRSGMIADIVRTSAAARTALDRADQSLVRLGELPCSPWILGEEPLAEDDLRATQIAILVADVCAFEAIREWGLRPDYLIGHSFGEYAALVASGVLDFDAALAITIARSAAVAGCASGQGAMLSVAAKLSDVRPLLTTRTDMFISHANAPLQTVVAGTKAAIAELAATTDRLGIAAVRIPVNSPFHTPLLQRAQSDLKIALSQHRWRPPRIPMLSSVSGRFVADRDDIVDNLVRQLVEPLNWVSHIERLMADDVRVFVEVGPGRVLSKLIHQIVGDRQVFVVTIDCPSLSLRERGLRIQAALEVAGIHSNPVNFRDPSVAVRVPSPEFHERSDEFNSSTRSTRRQAVIGSQWTQPTKDLRDEPSHFANAKQRHVVADTKTPSREEITPCRRSLETEDRLYQFLVDVIVEKTGYPRDVIEIDWDLESDLGIDSIRKAQILGELREYIDATVLSEGEHYSELRTVRDILTLLRRSSEKGDWLETLVPQFATTLPSIERVAFSEGSNSGDNDSQFAIDAANSHVPANADPLAINNACYDLLIDFVVERTGYPRDVIDLDADLESDLGIDSIVKAQLIGEVRDHFQFTAVNASQRATLSETRTLRHMIEIVEILSDTVAEPSSSGYEDGIVPNASNQEIEVPGDAPSPVDNRNRPEHRSNDKDSVPRLAVEHSISAGSSTSKAFARGQYWGKRRKRFLQNELFDFADRAGTDGTNTARLIPAFDSKNLSLVEEAELRGVADGADVLLENLHNVRDGVISRLSAFDCVDESADDSWNHENRCDIHDDNAPTLNRDTGNLRPSALTNRFRLEMSSPQKRPWTGRCPEFAGGAIVIGNNPESDELTQRLKSFGVTVCVIRELGSRDEALATLQSTWESTPSPHLFVLSPRDARAATTLDERQWIDRRENGITSLFWFCQKWLALVEQSKMLEDASLIGVTALGGEFGVGSEIASAESGALTGLFKSIIIECWMNGYRAIPIKLLDLPSGSKASNATNAICIELTEPSYDVEIGWDGDRRSVLRSVPDLLDDSSKGRLIPAGHWIVTGGARGITAFLVRRMAARYPKVHFHLIGTAPRPVLSQETRQLGRADSAALRNNVMRSARNAGLSPLKAWQDMEKAIEIDQSLTDFHSAGIPVTYHSCDVANRAQLSEVIEGIRRDFGSIDGVIHGAGIGKDAAFQRKEPEMVERCLGAKLDGVLNLISLTQHDLIQGFIAFGSISGRFGANGHTDYSLANDMLAKLVRWHRQLRPDVPSAAFHWHAWDDIGMAMKPETRLALKMIGMQLMSADEGAEHFLREIDAGLPLAEVLITDTRYYRMFYPADRIVTHSARVEPGIERANEWPLIRNTTRSNEDMAICDAVLDPVSDPFLIEHRLRSRPILPMVIMAELIAEGAAILQKGTRPTALRDFEIASSVKFLTDVPRDVRVYSTRMACGAISTELRGDFHSRSGKLVSSNRLYAKAIVESEIPSKSSQLSERLNRDALGSLDFQPAVYPPYGSDFYSGGPLRCLRKYAIVAEDKRAWGRISAPSLGELAGAQRDVVNWLTPSAVIDAMLFTSGLLAWKCFRPGIALPQLLKRIEFNRLPRPAEVCWVRTQVVGQNRDAATFDMTLWGSDELPLLVISGYVAAWLPE